MISAKVRPEDAHRFARYKAWEAELAERARADAMRQRMDELAEWNRMVGEGRVVDAGTQQDGARGAGWGDLVVWAIVGAAGACAAWTGCWLVGEVVQAWLPGLFR